MEYNKLRDKCRGALVGGAVGDALGYEVEFMSLSSIIKRFGKNGITRYATYDGIAMFSDDTQMTLFTLEGLMNGIIASMAGKPEDILPSIRDSYLTWYKTQTSRPSVVSGSWLGNVRALWNRRAPGNTCMNSLNCVSRGRVARNNSKGCGGVMRVAPIGIFNAAHPDLYSYEDTSHLAGWAAEITHSHIASTFASAMLASVVENCITDEKVSRLEFGWIIDGGLTMMSRYFPGHEEELEAFRKLVSRAVELGKSDVPQREAIRELGEGWVGDEAFAIAVFSVMRHIDNFEECVVCAVNHDGDSDSTGAIAGNMIGAILGYSAIPQYYLESLEIESVLVSAADDLCADINIPEVKQRLVDRYVKHIPTGIDGALLI